MRSRGADRDLEVPDSIPAATEVFRKYAAWFNAKYSCIVHAIFMLYPKISSMALALPAL